MDYRANSHAEFFCPLESLNPEILESYLYNAFNR